MVFKLIKEVIKTGEATLPYPFAPIEVAPGFRGKPEYNPDQCIACAACTIACPPNALSMENDLENGTRTWSIFYGRCIFCGRCEEVCPTGAIKLGPDFELASFSRDDLVIQAEFPLAACTSCGAYFASEKSLAHALALLEQDWTWKHEQDEDRDAAQAQFTNLQAILQLCPHCRRKKDLARLKPIIQEAFNGHV